MYSLLYDNITKCGVQKDFVFFKCILKQVFKKQCGDGFGPVRDE
jgi:hypothetical protein